MTTLCDGCARVLGRAAYRFYDGDGARVRCRACALTYPPLMRRSLSIALVVGSVLIAINQGDALLSGHWERALVWKVPLTYLVPFVVATWGALLNSRVREGPPRGQRARRPGLEASGHDRAKTADESRPSG